MRLGPGPSFDASSITCLLPLKPAHRCHAAVRRDTDMELVVHSENAEIALVIIVLVIMVVVIGFPVVDEVMGEWRRKRRWRR
jgi:hypothetical protein